MVNVGVNASHGALRSPIFTDGTFEFLPIPEDRRLWSPTLPAYPKLAAYNDPDKTLSKASRSVWSGKSRNVVNGARGGTKGMWGRRLHCLPGTAGWA